MASLPEISMAGTFSLDNSSTPASLEQNQPIPSKSAVTDVKTQQLKEWLMAIAILIIFVGLATGAIQLSNLAFTSTENPFQAPFFFVVFNTAFRSLAFPFYLLLNTVMKVLRGRRFNYQRTLRRCLVISWEDGNFVEICLKFFPPTIFNLISQILYIVGLRYLTASLASALGPPAIATSYLLSWMFLRTKLLTIKVLFVIVTFFGVAVIAYGQLYQSFNTDAVIGISAFLLSDIGLSFYQIMFKKSFPHGDLGQISLAVSLMYLLMFVLYVPVPIILQQTGMETYNISQLPYPYLVGSWMCSSAGSLTYAYGLVVAGGFFMGLSDLVILAANAGIDALRGIPIGTYQVIGTVIIAAAFLVLVLPEPYVSISIRERLRKLTEKIPKTLEGPDASGTGSGPEASERKRFAYRGLAAFSPYDMFALNEEADDVLERRDLLITDQNTQIKL